MLAMNAPYRDSYPHAMPLGGSLLHMDDAPVLHLAEKREGPEHPYDGSGPELCQLPRISIPRTSVNRSKKEGQRLLCSEG
jgi:hypothetical protein